MNLYRNNLTIGSIPQLDVVVPDFFPKTGLFSYYKLDGNSNDSAGSNNGTDINITYSLANGKIDQGAGFNGSSKISIADHANLRFNNNFSLVFWAKQSEDAVYRYFYRKQYAVAGTYQGCNIVRMLSANSYKLRFEVLTGSSTAYQIFSNATFPNNTWVHVVCSMDNGYLKMYINSVLQTDTKAGIMTASTEPLDLGTTCTGAMDEVAIYNTVLTQAQIDLIYNSGNGSTL